MQLIHNLLTLRISGIQFLQFAVDLCLRFLDCLSDLLAGSSDPLPAGRKPLLRLILDIPVLLLILLFKTQMQSDTEFQRLWGTKGNVGEEKVGE